MSLLPTAFINAQQPAYVPYTGGSSGTINTSNINIAVGGAITFSNDNQWDSAGIEWNTDTTGTSTINIAPVYLNDETGANTSVGLGVQLTGPSGTGFQNFGVNSLYLNTGYGSIPGAVLMNDPTAPGRAYVSSIRTNTAQTSNFLANNATFALGQVGSIYTSSLTGVATANASTLICNFNAQGNYLVNLGFTTGVANGFPMCGIATIGENTTTPNTYYYRGFTQLYPSTSTPYGLSISGPANQNGPAELYLDNSGGISPTYTGTFTRIGF